MMRVWFLFDNYLITYIGPLAQLVRAPDSDGQAHRNEPRLLELESGSMWMGNLQAQVRVLSTAHNQMVAGSSPAGATSD